MRKLPVAICVAWICGQIALIGTAGRRADGAFGFRMFSESTTITIHLVREIHDASGTVAIPVVAEEWIAHDSLGVPHRFKWDERVVDPVLSHLDVTMHAAYGAAAQLERIQAALDDVATHIGEDDETCALEATVTFRKNGRDAEEVVLRSAPRTCGVSR
ncbi:hypothetical protein BH09MYX1_BH09MYX1_32580 [soil metagenome]